MYCVVLYCIVLSRIVCIVLYSMTISLKGVFKGGGGGLQGVQTPPEIFNFFLKSEGKEVKK